MEAVYLAFDDVDGQKLPNVVMTLQDGLRMALVEPRIPRDGADFIVSEYNSRLKLYSQAITFQNRGCRRMRAVLVAILYDVAGRHGHWLWLPGRTWPQWWQGRVRHASLT